MMHSEATGAAAIGYSGRYFGSFCGCGEDYATRNFNYVRALDQLAREKARQIVEILLRETWEPPVLDIGGGAGSLCRFLVAALSGSDPKRKSPLQQNSDLTLAPGNASDTFRGVVLDLPEVIAAARKIYPDERDWEGIETIGADFRFHAFEKERSFGLDRDEQFSPCLWRKGSPRDFLKKRSAF